MVTIWVDWAQIGPLEERALILGIENGWYDRTETALKEIKITK